MAEKEDFKLTKEEADSLREAFKKDEFRKLLAEYAEEISDPTNKKLYEEEITKLEKERGVDVQFVHPMPGHVLKTCSLPSKKKLFINIAMSDLIAPAKPQEKKLKDNHSGQMWSIPYSLTPPRDDIDKAKNKIVIIDAIFHTETYKKGQKEPHFNDLLEATALDSIENDLKMKLDRKHIKRLKQPYKGFPYPSVIRNQTDDPKSPEPVGPLQIPYPPLKEQQNTEKKKKKSQIAPKSKQEPKYTIVHRGELDIQDYTCERTSKAIKRPKDLVVTIELPGVDTAANLEVDIFEKAVVLNHTQPQYHLELALPYPVDEDTSQAKFNKSNHTLTLTFPVVGHVTTPITNEPMMTTSDSPDINDSTERINEITSDSDLITTTTENASKPTEQVTECVSQDTVRSDVKSDWSIQEQWKCPPFSYQQEDEIISFVLHIVRVKESTVTKFFDDHSFHLTFKGGESSLSSYSFYVEFPRNCFLNSELCEVKLSETNLVIILQKKIENKTEKNDNVISLLWQTFKVGVSPNKTENKLFLTEDNVINEILNSEDEQSKKEVTEPVQSLDVIIPTQDEAIVTLPLSEKEEVKENGLEVVEEKKINHVSDDTGQKQESTERQESTFQHDVKLSNTLIFDLD